MKKGRLTQLFFFFFITNTFFHVLEAQVFQRVEDIAGFESLLQNHGVAVADFNGDHVYDIFVVAKALDQEGVEKTHSKLYINNDNGSFTDVTLFSGLNNLLTEDYADEDVFYVFDGPKIGAFWGDYDNDGLPDLLMTNTYNVLLFHNEGNGTFSDVTDLAGFNLPTTCQFTGATWFDYNNDGLLDIYICEWGNCSSNQMFRNNGDGTFTNVTEEVNMLEPISRFSFTALPYDFNDDNLMDLYVTNDFRVPNYLYINNGDGTFSEQAQDYGVNSTIEDMGLTIGDYNLDETLDIYITGKGESALFKNGGNGFFSNNAQLENFYNSGWAWGTTFADFDLDGDEDLFVTNGYYNSGPEYNFYYRNEFNNNNGFPNVTNSSGLYDLSEGINPVDFDYDNDGDLDLFVTNADINPFFYENTILNFENSITSSNNWFQISLEGTISNRSAIGTEVTLTTESRTLKRYFSGVGMLSQSIKPLHFGLNNDENILEITIKWPSGLLEVYDQNIQIDSFYKAVEGEGLTNLNIDPSIKVYGCTDPMSCNYNPNATLSDGSCTYLTSGTISGSTNVNFLSEEIYGYTIDPESTAHWEVQGGEILEGQGTSQILVKWGLNPLGEISVTEMGANCSGQTETLSVNLGLSESFEDVSVARLWNEALLGAIRKDFARPTVHARNLFHSSVAMYDIWAIYDNEATPYFIGNEVHGFSSSLDEFSSSEDTNESRRKAISYAMYRLLTHRFQNSPNQEQTQALFDYLMEELGYDATITSTDYQSGDPVALGNYVAEMLINYGLIDGARESTGYDNEYYESINPPLAPEVQNSTIQYPNRWQSLNLQTYIDQSGNLIEGDNIPFLSPEWGNVYAFALSEEDKTTYTRDGNTYFVFKDPSDPPYLGATEEEVSNNAYKWAFSLVSVWSSHLDPNDGVLWDVSPNSIGGLNIEDLPNTYLQHPSFYDLLEGGDPGEGHAVNPSTGLSYEEQLVPRGDYTRVLAEFWADGPDSETPPGHWFTLLNYVSDHPDLEKRLNGQGDILPDLEWDVKTYFILGGAMHDAAVAAWSVKGWYDYIRPISAIRYMANLGQSSDNTLSNYHADGIPLIPNYIEVVEEGDPLAGATNQHVGKIKLYTWKGHDYVYDTETDVAGVDWILAENWWPYQRPSFVTPPFAGYVSGHSTFSRAAAEVMTLVTGDEYFPGGMGEFVARKNEFLVFEEGPSTDVILQWATYRDASDQCSLSRIWGGIHPPSDDIPGRFMGEEIGIEAYNFAIPYFYGSLGLDEYVLNSNLYPNPVVSGNVIHITHANLKDTYVLYDLSGRQINIEKMNDGYQNDTVRIRIPQSTSEGIYILSWNGYSEKIIVKN
ncbi:FG-GAP-like repeat-containing protein [Mangrovimonas spongiae]|uniref:T9SS C-terminal target domain-containing protein n=1 Tax=Mangrovimonas spongiae TaxID=2494697 RepID=A0A428K2N2_9FLAO|nr:FG-GAP-like repeat-containing protein [Mangrovimonas spongiae]RSK40643.1 T9SS C-terminal target domain-containing protein [Mangrovimonas spongiae]